MRSDREVKRQVGDVLQPPSVDHHLEQLGRLLSTALPGSVHQLRQRELINAVDVAVPSVSDEIPTGVGSPVTTTCGSRPLRFRMRFSASLRAFWARSLRRVHLQETTACRIGCGCIAARIVA